MTIRMNVKMEHFTSGWCPILKEDLHQQSVTWNDLKVGGEPCATTQRPVKCISWAELKCKTIWEVLNSTFKAYPHEIHQCVCASVCGIHLLSSSLPCKWIVLFHWPSTRPSSHRLGVCVRLSSRRCGCTHVPVSVYFWHASRDPWWWIRAGTNVLVHLWNENQGERVEAEEGCIKLKAYRNKLTPDGSMTHTHTLYAPNSIYFFSETSAQNRPDSPPIQRDACGARHVWPHHRKKKAMNEVNT